MTPKLNVFSIVVADMGKALAFYRKLGLNLPPEADAQPHVELEIASGVKVVFDTIPTVLSFHPTWTPPTGGERMGLAFECADPAEVDRVYHELVDAGYDGCLEPWDAFWNQRYARLLDPDGNCVDLFVEL
jgi:catechol 2,3-dioxygenase-like lactoylglutathione lyase family enzyme